MVLAVDRSLLDKLFHFSGDDSDKEDFGIKCLMSKMSRVTAFTLDVNVMSIVLVFIITSCFTDFTATALKERSQTIPQIAFKGTQGPTLLTDSVFPFLPQNSTLSLTFTLLLPAALVSCETNPA